MDHRISVVIPAYRAEPFIEETLDRVNGQTRQPDEIIVIIDGSPDNTAERVRSWSARNRPDLVLIEQPNRGAAAARNCGIRRATGDLVAPVDADDAVLPNHLELLEFAFTARPDIVLAFGDATTYDRSTLDRDSYLEGSRIVALDYDEGPRGLRIIRGSAYAGIVGGSRIATPASLYSRDAMMKAGLYDESYAQGEDAEFLMRLSRTGTFAYFMTPIVKIRRHEHNLSHRRNRIANRQCKVVLYQRLLARAAELDLKDDEIKLTREAMSKAATSLLRHASEQGLGTYLSQLRWAAKQSTDVPLVKCRDILRALKYTLPTSNRA